MSTENTPATGKTARKTVLGLALLLWTIGVPVCHGLVPWGLSLMSPRFGWRGGVPSVLNQAGLIFAAGGATGLFWVFWTSLRAFEHVPEHVDLPVKPVLLLRGGPYTYTRNPMYAAELLLWLGWSIYFGSVIISAITALAWLVMVFIVVPREERTLEERFGAAYLGYRDSVPRWLHRPHR